VVVVGGLRRGAGRRRQVESEEGIMMVLLYAPLFFSVTIAERVEKRSNLEVTLCVISATVVDWVVFSRS
jgi:hypothetical protein